MKHQLIILFLLPSFLAFAQPIKKYATKEQRKAFYQQLGKKYGSPSIQEVFNSDKKDEFENYLDGDSEAELLKSYSTVIHEVLHGYNNSENGGFNYFVETGIRIFVTPGKYYNSTEINKFLRKGQQDSIFRYALYVGGNQPVLGQAGKNSGNRNTKMEDDGFSIVYGIYGLIEEYNAYYFGALSTFELYDHYRSLKGRDDPEVLEDYKHHILGDVMAHYEFNLFFAWYMRYAKLKHPDIYADILNNKPLRVLYTLLEDRFQRLADATELQLAFIRQKSKPDMMEVLDFSGSQEDVFLFMEIAGLEPSMIYSVDSLMVNGKKVAVKKNILEKDIYAQMKAGYDQMVRELKTVSGNGFEMLFVQHQRYINYLKSQYTTELVTELENLKIKGVTGMNYREYLK